MGRGAPIGRSRAEGLQYPGLAMESAIGARKARMSSTQRRRGLHPRKGGLRGGSRAPWFETALFAPPHTRVWRHFHTQTTYPEETAHRAVLEDGHDMMLTRLLVLAARMRRVIG